MFIHNPENIPRIYSELLENVQDRCARAGIEITSPHYSAIGNGNKLTMPDGSVELASMPTFSDTFS